MQEQLGGCLAAGQSQHITNYGFIFYLLEIKNNPAPSSSREFQQIGGEFRHFHIRESKFVTNKFMLRAHCLQH